MRSTRHACDLTGRDIASADLPIVIRITVAVPRDATRDPARDELPPFLRAMLYRPDGSARPGVLELSAEAFARCFAVDLDALRQAFDG